MNILYFHANLLRDTYRCRQVRARLLGFISSSDFDVIFIGGVDKNHLAGLSELKQQLAAFTYPIIEQNGNYRIHDFIVTLDSVSMLVDQQRFIPLDGTVLAIQTEPYIKGSYISLDLFADESFSSYHGDMDPQTFLELRELLTATPNVNKNNLN